MVYTFVLHDTVGNRKYLVFNSANQTQRMTRGTITHPLKKMVSLQYQDISTKPWPVFFLPGPGQ